MTCPICGRLYCDHTPAQRGQTVEEMLEDMNAPHIIDDDGLTKRVTQEEYDRFMGKGRKYKEDETKERK